MPFIDQANRLTTHIFILELLLNMSPLSKTSYKWTSAGLLSNVHDLLKYGNAMLYSYKTSNGILKQETMRLFWQPNELTYLGTIGDLPFRYGGMGWQVVDKKAKNKYKGYERMSLNSIVLHSGTFTDNLHFRFNSRKVFRLIS